MKKPTKVPQFGTRTPIYPRTGYMGFFQLENKEFTLWYPYDILKSNLEQLLDELVDFEKKLDETVQLGDLVIVLPLTLRTLYPLEARFWQKPTVHYTHTQRIELFHTLLSYPKIFEILVTPALYKKKDLLMTALPFSHATDMHTIEQFMLLSDYPVDATATCAAIYNPSQPYTINWKTKERIDSFQIEGARIQH